MTKVYDVSIRIRRDPQSFSELLNEMAMYVESNGAPPNHWDERKRRNFYAGIYTKLSSKAKEMIHKLNY